MPRDWPDPRWPDHRSTGRLELALAAAAMLVGLASVVAAFWPA